MKRMRGLLDHNNLERKQKQTENTPSYPIDESVVQNIVYPPPPQQIPSFTKTRSVYLVCVMLFPFSFYLFSRNEQKCMPFFCLMLRCAHQPLQRSTGLVQGVLRHLPLEHSTLRPAVWSAILEQVDYGTQSCMAGGESYPLHHGTGHTAGRLGVCVRVCVCMRVCTCMCACTCMCVCVHACMYVCLGICLCLPTSQSINQCIFIVT